MRSKVTTAGVALALLVSVAVSASAQGAGKVSMQDFSGVWVLDAAKSEGVPQGIEETMTVKQEGGNFTIEGKMKTPRGERTRNETFASDGKEGEFTVRMGPNETKGKRTAKWSPDGKVLEVSENVNFTTPDGTAVESKGTRRWTLSADGKTLTIDESRTSGPRGPQQAKRVYTKQ